MLQMIHFGNDTPQTRMGAEFEGCNTKISINEQKMTLKSAWILNLKHVTLLKTEVLRKVLHTVTQVLRTMTETV